MKKRNILLLSTFLVFGSCVTNNPSNSTSVSTYKFSQKEEAEDPSAVDGLQIKMIDLHDKFGDCTLIRYKDKNIMIDVGGSAKSGPYIYDALKDIKTLDYLILTHADSDHISNFISEDGLLKWINEGGVINTLIDFDNEEKQHLFNTGLSVIYKALRDALKLNKKILNHFTSSDCINKTNGASDVFKLDKLELRILNNYYYTHDLYQGSEAANKNCLSTCCLLTLDDHKYLFTGDLEEFDSGRKIDSNDGYNESEENIKTYKRIYGETMLLINNYKYLKDGVDFFKAGHHGSDTSNSSTLLDVIRPKYIGVSAALKETHDGSRPFMPGETALANMCKWTDYVYVQDKEDVENPKNYIPYHGELTFEADERGNNPIYYSDLTQNSLNKSGILDEYLLENRLVNMNIYTLGDVEKNGLGLGYLFEKAPRKIGAKEEFPDYIEYLSSLYDKALKTKTPNLKISNATYIKFGHIDILINFGEDTDSHSTLTYNNVKKVDYLCNDKELDYLILSHYGYDTFINLVGRSGLLNKTKINKIDNFYHFGVEAFQFNKNLQKTFQDVLKHKLIKDIKQLTSSDLNGKSIDIINEAGFNLEFEFLNLYNTNKKLNTVLNGSIDLSPFCLNFKVNASFKKQSYSYLNLGNYKFYDNFVTEVVNDNKTLFNSVDTIEMLSHGALPESSEAPKYNFYLKKFNKPDYLFNGTYKFPNLSSDKNSIPGSKFPNTKLFTDSSEAPIFNAYSTAVFDSKNEGNKNTLLGGNIVTKLQFGREGNERVDFRKQVLYADSFDYYSNGLSGFIKNKGHVIL